MHHCLKNNIYVDNFSYRKVKSWNPLTIDHLLCSGDHNIKKERDNIENILEITTEVGWYTLITFMI